MVILQETSSIKEFAILLKNSVEGRDDWVARYGGEEFLIDLRNISILTALELTEKIRKKVEDSEFNFQGNNIRITSSFGVCSLNKSWNI